MAKSALAIEIVCHYGGPRLVICVYSVAKLNSKCLRSILMETVKITKISGGCPVSFICDNCPMNPSVYKELGGPGKVKLDGTDVFLVSDYVHILKNLRNNWITEKSQQLTFTENDFHYQANWTDINTLYEENKKTAQRLTNLTHTSVFPKPLQWQSVPLVCQVFNEKTVAAFKALRDKVVSQEGSIRFIKLVTDWFKMMNVKDK